MYNDELRIRKFVRALKLRSSLNIEMYFKFQYVCFFLFFCFYPVS
jgi:hypothetical protein